MEKKVINYIHKQEMITAGDRVLIGVSGGADSLALLYFLDKFKIMFEIELGVAHLHHGLRGADADADERFVRDFCRKREIPFFSTQKDIRELSKVKKISIEEAGRFERYSFFETIMQREGYHKIALGHHINDQAETMLMRLIRGTGIKGVSGIKSNSWIIRPFLCLEKKEIVEYCNEHELLYRTDATNFQRDYTRNKIRLDIMPQIRGINPQAEVHFNAFTVIAGEYEEFFSSYVDEIENRILVKKEAKVYIDRDRWLKEKRIVQSELLRRAIGQFKGSLKEIEYNHITAFERLIKGDKTTGEIHFPLGIKGVRRYDLISIESLALPERQIILSKRILPDKIYVLSSLRMIIKTEILGMNKWNTQKDEILEQDYKNHSEKYFDYDKMNSNLMIRTRKTGDFFYPVGLEGRKTIKKYFIDRKVEREKRDLIPLLAVDNEVIWIAGYGVNKRFLADDKTENVLKIQITLC